MILCAFVLVLVPVSYPTVPMSTYTSCVTMTPSRSVCVCVQDYHIVIMSTLFGGIMHLMNANKMHFPHYLSLIPSLDGITHRTLQQLCMQQKA